jgi:hypothetical protein
MLAGIAASLVAMFALLRSFGLHPVAAGAGAVAFASSPMSVEQLFLGHLGFAQLWVFPLLLGSLLWARSGRAARAVAPGVAYALSFYVFSYLGLLCSLLVVTFGLAVIWERRSLRLDVRKVGVWLAAAGLGLLPAALATRIAPSSRIGLPHLAIDDLFGARLEDFFVPSSRHALYGRVVKAAVGTHVGDAVEFFGYATLVLAVVGVVMLARRRLVATLPVRFSVLAVPLGWFAAFPAQTSILGLRVPLPDPARAIGGLTSWWRVYDRFGAVAGFGLVILAATALDRLLRSERQSRVLAAWAAVVVIVLEAVPGLPVPTLRIHADAAARWLRGHPGGAVALYPAQPPVTSQKWSDRYWLSYYLQTYHHHPLFVVPGGTPEGTYKAVAASLAGDISSPTTPAILRGEGVRWVVLHRDLYSELGEPQPRLPQGLKIAATFPGGQILRVTAAPANLVTLLEQRQKRVAHRIAVGSAITSFGQGFYGSERFGPYSNAHWLGQDGKVEITLPNAITVPYVVYEVRLHAFSTGTTHTVQMDEGSHRVATFQVPTSAVVVDRLIRFPGPNSTLTFTVSPGPIQLSPLDTRRASVYFLELTVRPVALQLSN